MNRSIFIYIYISIYLYTSLYLFISIYLDPYTYIYLYLYMIYNNSSLSFTGKWHGFRSYPYVVLSRFLHIPVAQLQ